MPVDLGSSSWALGTSVAVFTLFSGVASTFLLMINIRNGQHYNCNVSILAIVIALGNFNSFAQQIYTLVHFSDLMLEAFRLATDMFRCNGSEPFPLFRTTNKSVSAFLSLQMFFVNSQGLLFFYWSLILFASSWSLSPVWWKNQKTIIGTKISCFALPAIQLGLLSLNSLRGNDFAQMILMNCIILVNIGMGSVFLVLTLAHVIHIHREAGGDTEVRFSRAYDGVVEFLPRENTLEKGLSCRKGTGIGRLYISSDGWLIARIALAFVMVEGLQIYIIAMQIFFLQRWAHFRVEWSRGLLEPLVDQSEEFANICSPIPGSFTGYLFFFVFGTTAESRAEIKKIKFGIIKWFYRFFSRSKGNQSEQSSFGRTLGSRNISYPKPESDSLLLSRTTSLNEASSFSSTRDKPPPTSTALYPPTSASSPRSQGIAFGIRFGLDVNSRLRIYSPHSPGSIPGTPVSWTLGEQHERAGSPRSATYASIPSPAPTKRAFFPDRGRRFSVPSAPVIL